MSNLLEINHRINPALFSLILTNAGYVPPDFKNHFNFCGITDSLNFTWISLAYFYPQAEFTILLTDDADLSYKVNAILDKLKISNLKIEKLKETNIGSKTFDYVALDLSYSRLYSDERERIKEILRKNLKENGIFYLEYESYPGSEAKFNFFKFIRILLKDWNTKEVYELLENFLIRPTSYLIKHSNLREYINNLVNEKEKEKINKLLLREILNENYKVFFFTEINNELSDSELTFCGRADLELNDPEISIFPSHIPTLLRFSKSLERRETAIDFILNISEHRDLYVKNPEKDFEKGLKFICDNFYLLPRQKAENLRRIVALPGGHRYPLTSAIYDYFYATGEEARTLCGHPMFKGNELAVWKAFYKVLSTGEFFLCIDDNTKPLEKVNPQLPSEFTISPLNEEILKRAVSELKGVYLTSEITKGVAIFLTPLETLLLWFAYKEGKDKAVEKTYEYLQSLNEKITFGGEPRSTKEVSKEDIEKIARNLFAGRKAFNLQRLRIVKFFR